MAQYQVDPADKHQVVSFITHLVTTGQPLLMIEGARQIGYSCRKLRAVLRGLHVAGQLKLEIAGSRCGSRYRIVLPDGRATPWSTSDGGRPPAPGEDEVMRRRIEAEEERIAHQRRWLAREKPSLSRDRPSRAGSHPAERFYMDRATALALQGISA